MTKKKKRLLVVVVLAVVFVALLARPVVNLVIEWLDPGQAPLNDLFKLKKNEVALVMNKAKRRDMKQRAKFMCRHRLHLLTWTREFMSIQWKTAFPM